MAVEEQAADPLRDEDVLVLVPERHVRCVVRCDPNVELAERAEPRIALNASLRITLIA